MQLAKALLGATLGPILFRRAAVVEVRNVSPRIRRVVLRGPALVGVAWVPGDKVQVFLPGVGMRTYTPAHWDPQEGTMSLIAFLHAEAPGASWARRLSIGDSVQLFGPQRSLVRSDGADETIVVGDETCFGLAHALLAAGGRAPLCLFEVDDRAEASLALGALGLHACSVTIERERGDGHHARFAAHVHEALATRPGASLWLSGKATSIQAVRSYLRERSVSNRTKTKAYWAPGKAGLD